MIFWNVFTSIDAHLNFRVSPLQQNFVSSGRTEFCSDYEQVIVICIITVLINITM
jgi:hypothetical protein